MSIIKDIFFGGAEKKAAQTQAAYGNLAIDEARAAREQAREDLSGFRAAGEGVLDPLQQLALKPYDDSIERENILRDVQGSAAARGKLGSGGTLKELGRQILGMQQRNRAQQFTELFNLATLGQNAAAGQATTTLQTGRDIGDTQTGIGNVLGAGRIGATNQTRNTLFSVLSTVLSTVLGDT